MINVTKTFLPPLDEYLEKLKQVWNSGWVTNQGPLAEELESRLKEYLGVKNLLLVTNGTIALQLAIKALGLHGEIITTPYSYVATTSSILWENCTPVFCDIEEKNFCIDAAKVQSLITEKTSAIIATHVYGFPCDLEKLKAIAERNNLKLIYDGAHAFGVKTNGRQLLQYGDVSTVSFHATKLFHTVEGGAVITSDDSLVEKLFLHRAFGHLDDEHFSVGINGRTSELNAAMGLCLLPRVNEFIQRRKQINELYRKNLADLPVTIPEIPDGIEYNYSYFPVIFNSYSEMSNLKKVLEDNGVFPRRYFYPSLNTLPYLNSPSCPVSESIADRVLCLPMYQQLSNDELHFICSIIIGYFKK